MFVLPLSFLHKHLHVGNALTYTEGSLATWSTSDKGRKGGAHLPDKVAAVARLDAHGRSVDGGVLA